MRHAEQVTFGGHGLDRAAHLRGSSEAQQELRAQPGARCILVWRGKPAVTASGQTELRLLRVSLDDAVLAGSEMLVFLGRESDGAPIFAADISYWQPDGQDLSALGQFTDPSEQQHPNLPDGHAFAELRRMMTRLSTHEAELAATAKAILGWHHTHGFCACCGARSAVAQAGWQRGCPSCGAQHFPRTDPVVIMLITHGDSVLLGRSPGWPEGMFSLLAGFVEPGETVEAAVRREVMEEASVPVGEVSYLASQPWPFPSSLMLGCRGEALSREIRMDPTEIEDALWLSRSEMMQVFAGEHVQIKPARKGAIAHFLLENWLADRLD
ncbi:NAD+ diphosphatase [Cribrihabitans marinus]|uniref:NAD(+) diphosphatase n=1 Tax=Cribrihabitans marinus TaxID=1227549 RepID=A0A1H6XD78_9RHOB|nr:NAD(+) diphosphatase [Cribrihabitans marinus]GGH27198.1 NADH pyrophosphatase [Cribrihabitans marinus]SEJ27099.1 NAD+ diphosphatase [Cribrihabitans marinus]